MIPDWPTLVSLRLNRGADRAQTIGELAETMQVHRSVVEHAIEAARKAGVPIRSGQAGVWLGESETEIRATADALAHRLVSQYQTVRAPRATAARYSKAAQQLAMWAE